MKIRKKALRAEEVKVFTDIPNVGPRIAKDFTLLGITNPHTLKKKDAFTLYRELEKKTHSRQDPCVLDTFIAVIDFMQGAPARPWHFYTKERKRKYGNAH